MLRFKLKKIEIAMSFSFFAVIALLQLIQGTNYMLFALIACIIHELGHIFVMCLLSIAPQKITFYGAGIKITPDYKKITSVFQDFLILIAGSATNLILFGILYPLSQNSFQIALFATFNLVIGIFNLIPFKHFDGGKIIELFINSSRMKNPIGVRKVIRVISIIMLIVFGVIFGLSQGINVSLYFSIGYIIFSELLL